MSRTSGFEVSWTRVEDASRSMAGTSRPGVVDVPRTRASVVPVGMHNIHAKSVAVCVKDILRDPVTVSVGYASRRSVKTTHKSSSPR